jgi:hypothetical protein
VSKKQSRRRARRRHATRTLPKARSILSPQIEPTNRTAVIFLPLTGCLPIGLGYLLEQLPKGPATILAWVGSVIGLTSGAYVISTLARARYHKRRSGRTRTARRALWTRRKAIGQRPRR